jgi:preprotein translocase subunit YajC
MITTYTFTIAQLDTPPNPPPAAPDPSQATATTEQTLAPATATDGDAPPAKRTGIDPLLIILMGVLAAMLIFSMTGQRKERKKRAKMLESMKKGDKVQTVGGIIGTIVEVRDDEIIVKVDDNTRIKFTRHAIQSITPDETA